MTVDFKLRKCFSTPRNLIYKGPWISSDVKLFKIFTTWQCMYASLICHDPLEQMSHSRNRNHVPFFHRVTETRLEVWKNEKCCGSTSRRRVFPQLFRVLPNFHECLYNSIETRKTCFLFLLENTATRKRKTTCYLWLSKRKFSLLAPSLHQQLVVVLCLHRVIETRFLTKQRVNFLKTVLMLI